MGLYCKVLLMFSLDFCFFMCILLFLTSCLIFLRYSRPGFVHTTCIWTLGQSNWEKWRAWGRKQEEKMRNKGDRKESRCFSAPCSRWVWAANCHRRLCSAVMPQWTKNTFIKRKFPRPIYAFEVIYFMLVVYWGGSAEGHERPEKVNSFQAQFVSSHPHNAFRRPVVFLSRWGSFLLLHTTKEQSVTQTREISEQTRPVSSRCNLLFLLRQV